jgi:hypothetical protein
MQQHLVSKVHRKKESEFLKKSGGSKGKKGAKAKSRAEQAEDEEEEEDIAVEDVEVRGEDVEAAALAAAVASQCLDGEAASPAKDAVGNAEQRSNEETSGSEDDYFQSPTTVFGFKQHIVQLSSSSSSGSSSDEDR